MRAIHAHARDGKDARLDANKRKVHKKKKKHDMFSIIHVVFFLKTVGCFSLSMLNVYPSRV